ncbi:MAG: hypothetical protein U5L96_06775 [Owenweeksia sp.]|nr:hypothetical protein [Owenweeksia sp.]
MDEEFEAMSDYEREIARQRIHSLTREVPPLPDFSFFHSSSLATPGVPGGNLQEAYFLAYNRK